MSNIVYVLRLFVSRDFDDYEDETVGVFSTYETLQEEIELMTKDWGEPTIKYLSPDKDEGSITWGSWFKTRVLTYHSFEIDRPNITILDNANYNTSTS